MEWGPEVEWGQAAWGQAVAWGQALAWGQAVAWGPLVAEVWVAADCGNQLYRSRREEHLHLLSHLGSLVRMSCSTNCVVNQ